MDQDTRRLLRISVLTILPRFRCRPRSLTRPADLLGADRARRGTPYRRLAPAARSCSCWAHLRNGDTPARLAGGFGISPTTAWRYIREAVDLLAATAPTLTQAMATIARLHSPSSTAAWS
jgi:hypothetical protein